MQNDKQRGALQDKFEGFASAPSAALWDNVSKEINPVKSSKTFLWWWISGSFAAMAIAGLAIVNYDNHMAQHGLSNVSDRDGAPVNKMYGTTYQSIENTKGNGVDSISLDAINNSTIDLNNGPNKNGELTGQFNKGLIKKQVFSADIGTGADHQTSGLQVDSEALNDENNELTHTIKNERGSIYSADLGANQNNVSDSTTQLVAQIDVKEKEVELTKAPVQDLLPFEKTQANLIATTDTSVIKSRKFVVGLNFAYWHNVGRTQDLSVGGVTIPSKNSEGEKVFHVGSFFHFDLQFGYQLKEKLNVYSGIAFSSRYHRHNLNADNMADLSLMPLEIFPNKYKVYSLGIPLGVKYHLKKIRYWDWAIGTSLTSEFPFMERYSNTAAFTPTGTEKFTNTNVSGYRLGATLDYYHSYKLNERWHWESKASLQYFLIDRYEGDFELPKPNLSARFSVGLYFAL